MNQRNAIPRFLLRRAVACALAIVMITLLAAFSLPVFASVAAGGTGTLVVLFLAAIAAPAFIYAVSRRSRRYAARVRDKDYRVCWTCGYDLRDLDKQGTCPECGEPFTLPELTQQWSMFERDTAGTPPTPPPTPPA